MSGPLWTYFPLDASASCSAASSCRRRCAGRSGRSCAARPVTPATAAGYGRLLSWLGGFGTVCLAGIEGTGSYGAGLARHVTAAGVRVVEVDRSDRQDRRRQGKSGPDGERLTPQESQIALLVTQGRIFSNARMVQHVKWVGS